MPKSKSRELLFSLTKKDFVITYYKGSGAGGQHRNKTMSGVRIQHLPSKTMAQSCETKSQHKNKKQAFRRLTKDKKFKIWLNKQAYLTMNTIEDIKTIVDNSVQPQYLHVEIKENSKWVTEVIDKD